MPETNESRDVVVGVMQLANLLTRRLAPMFEKANITPQQFAVLLVIAEPDGPTNLAALARRMLVSKQNMTGMVQRLEQAGFTERTDDPSDLRSSRIVPTRRGRGLIDKLRPLYDEWCRQLGADMNDRDFASFAKTLERLIERLRG